MKEEMGQTPAAEPGAFNFGEIFKYEKQVIMDPAGFFRRMPRQGGYLGPMIFVVAIAVATAIVQIAMSMIGLGSAGIFTASLAGLVLLPVFSVVGSFLGAAILFVIWKIMGSKENFETAYRCAAYAYGYAPVAAVVSGVPYLGTVVQVLWPAVLLALATIYVHERKPGLAWGVFGGLGIIAAISMIGMETAAYKISGNLEKMSQSLEEYEDEEGKEALQDVEKALGKFMNNMKDLEK